MGSRSNSLTFAKISSSSFLFYFFLDECHVLFIHTFQLDVIHMARVRNCNESNIVCRRHYLASSCEFQDRHVLINNAWQKKMVN